MLDIKVPERAAGGLGRALLDQWPAYAASVVSFLTIGIIWMNHHAVFANLVRVDRTILLINLLLLGWVALIPWPTHLTATYMRDGGNDERVAAVVYASVMTGMGFTFGALWRYASKRRNLIGPRLSDADVRRSTRQFTLGAPAYLVATGIALISAPLSLAIIGALAIYYLSDSGGAIQHPTDIPDNSEGDR